MELSDEEQRGGKMKVVVAEESSTFGDTLGLDLYSSADILAAVQDTETAGEE